MNNQDTRLSRFPPVLDACCGSRIFWFDRKNPLALFVDKRQESHILCDGRSLEISPDVVADFTDLPFPDNTFYLVVFDPPHMTSLGENSWMAKKYGRLIGDWRDMIHSGFEECFRVLKPHGTLVFKWNETDVKLKEVLELAPIAPLFGHTTGRQAKTIWATFLKPTISPSKTPTDGLAVKCPRCGGTNVVYDEGAAWAIEPGPCPECHGERFVRYPNINE